jgi:hypothetical protein
LGVAAAGHIYLTHILYPLYIGLGNTLLSAIIITRRPVAANKTHHKQSRP